MPFLKKACEDGEDVVRAEPLRLAAEVMLHGGAPEEAIDLLGWSNLDDTAGDLRSGRFAVRRVETL